LPWPPYLCLHETSGHTPHYASFSCWLSGRICLPYHYHLLPPSPVGQFSPPSLHSLWDHTFTPLPHLPTNMTLYPTGHIPLPMDPLLRKDTPTVHTFLFFPPSPHARTPFPAHTPTQEGRPLWLFPSMDSWDCPPLPPHMCPSHTSSPPHQRHCCQAPTSVHHGFYALDDFSYLRMQAALLLGLFLHNHVSRFTLTLPLLPALPTCHGTCLRRQPCHTTPTSTQARLHLPVQPAPTPGSRFTAGCLHMASGQCHLPGCRGPTGTTTHG